MDIVSLREAIDYIIPVLGITTTQISRHPNVERSISLTGKEVDAGPHAHLILTWFPGSLDPRLRGGDEVAPGKKAPPALVQRQELSVERR
jgi:hypothetical protein